MFMCVKYHDECCKWIKHIMHPKMAGTVAKKTADVHSVDSKKTHTQHLENLLKRIYELLLGILETMWYERQELHSIFGFVVTCCVVSKHHFTFLCLHFSFHPLSPVFRTEGLWKSLYYTFVAFTMKPLQYK